MNKSVSSLQAPTSEFPSVRKQAIAILLFSAYLIILFGRTGHHSLSGERLGEDIAQAKDLYDQLCSPGYNAFIERHGINCTVSWSIGPEWWKVGNRMSTRMAWWEVFENFREADKENYWEDYVIPADW